jgi:hypothetical protein
LDLNAKAKPKVNVEKQEQVKINNSLKKMAKERNIVSKQVGGIDAMVVTNEGTIERSKWLLAKIQVMNILFERQIINSLICSSFIMKI